MDDNLEANINNSNNNSDNNNNNNNNNDNNNSNIVNNNNNNNNNNASNNNMRITRDEIAQRHVLASLFRCEGKALCPGGLSTKFNGCSTETKLYASSVLQHKVSLYQSAIEWLNIIGLTEWHKDKERLGDRGMFVLYLYYMFHR